MLNIFNSSSHGLTSWRTDAGIKKPGSCGILLHISLYNGCCYSSLIPQSGPFNISSMPQPADFSFTTSTMSTATPNPGDIPISSAGSSYCRFKALKHDSLFSMNEMWILASPFCLMGRMSCNENGTLSVYPSADCKGSPLYFSLPQDIFAISKLSSSALISPVHIQDNFLGDVNASFLSVQEAKSSIDWYTYYPGFMNVSGPEHISYYAAFCFYAMAVCGTIIIGFFYMNRFYHGRTVFMLAYVLSQIFWLFWIILDAYLLFAIIEDPSISHILFSMRDCLLGLCTLLSVFITSNILLILTKKYTLRNQVIALILLIALQFSLSGSFYVGQLLLPYNPLSAIWKKLIPVWVSFFYFYDLTPASYVFLKSYQLNRFSSSRRLAVFRKNLKYALLLVSLQILNALWYIGMYYVANYTLLLGNDKYLSAMEGAYAFSYVFHSVITCILNHRMRKMINLVDNKPSNGRSIENLETLENRKSISSTNTSYSSPPSVFPISPQRHFPSRIDTNSSARQILPSQVSPQSPYSILFTATLERK